MTPEQAAAFDALPFARDAVAVRRWDDEAKDPAVTPPAFAYFEPLLGDLPRA
jgi:gamma-butyrobetaine dioxygenase